MAYIERVMTKRFMVLFQSKYLKTVFKREKTVLDQNVTEFSTLQSTAFDLYKSTPVKENKQQSNMYCSIVKKETAEKKEIQNEKLPSIKRFDEVDLSGSDLIGTFRNLVEVYRSRTRKMIRLGNFDNELKVFINSDEFRNYCNALEQRLPILSASELKFLLHCDLFHIPPSSTLMQKIYHLIIEKINDYSGFEALSIYLKINNETSQQNLKCRVLQKVCQQYFWHKLFISSRENIDYNDVAGFSQKKETPLSARKKLLQLLRDNFMSVHYQIGLLELSKMFKAFGNSAVEQYFLPQMFSVLKRRITDELDFTMTVNLLYGFKNLLNRKLSYDENFFDKLVAINIAKNPNVISSTILSKNFLELGHFSLPLIQHIEAKFTEPIFCLKSRKLCLNMARVFSNAYYHPFGYKGEDLHRKAIEKLDLYTFKLLQLTDFVNWCFCVTVLGTERKLEYLNQLFQHLTETYKDQDINGELSASTAEKITTLSAFARKNFPGDVQTLPEEFLEKCHNILKTNFSAFTNKFISDTLKKSGQVLENCTTSMHQFINFVVLLNDDKAINEENKSSGGSLRIEDIELSPQSKMILYQIYRGDYPYEYRNYNTLPGQVQLYLETFDQFHCKVVLIAENHLKRLHIEDQKSYIMYKINEGMTN